MLYSELIHVLYQKLAGELPGEEAHALMAPYKRKTANEVKKSDSDPKWSAVLIVLYPKNDDIYFSLIQRPDYNGTHGGQISLPGGKQEKFESLKETALRETHEEIGIHPEQVQVLGELTHVYIPPSNFIVAPYIGFLDQTPTLIKDPVEVEEIIEVKLNDLLNDELIKRKKVQIAKYSTSPFNIEVPYFQLNYKTVWGATALILSEVRALLKN